MRKKKGIVIALAAALLVTGLTGCAENQIPDLNEDEVQAVGEYVALTMMKYDFKHRSRLMELSEVVPEDTTEPPQETEPSKEEDPSGMAPVEDTPTVDAPGKVEEFNSAYQMGKVMGLPEGLSVSFVGQELCDSYPAEGDIFSMDATKGQKLLVMHFLLSNESEQDQAVDLLSQKIVFQVTVNGSYSKAAFVTMLLDDMATYSGNVPAGVSIPVVLVTEVEEGISGNISSISLSAKNGEKTAVLKLF